MTKKISTLSTRRFERGREKWLEKRLGSLKVLTEDNGTPTKVEDAEASPPGPVSRDLRTAVISKRKPPSAVSEVLTPTSRRRRDLGEKARETLLPILIPHNLATAVHVCTTAVLFATFALRGVVGDETRDHMLHVAAGLQVVIVLVALRTALRLGILATVPPPVSVDGWRRGNKVAPAPNHAPPPRRQTGSPLTRDMKQQIVTHVLRALAQQRKQQARALTQQLAEARRDEIEQIENAARAMRREHLAMEREKRRASVLLQEEMGLAMEAAEQEARAEKAELKAATLEEEQSRLKAAAEKIQAAARGGLRRGFLHKKNHMSMMRLWQSHAGSPKGRKGKRGSIADIKRSKKILTDWEAEVAEADEQLHKEEDRQRELLRRRLAKKKRSSRRKRNTAFLETAHAKQVEHAAALKLQRLYRGKRGRDVASLHRHFGHEARTMMRILHGLDQSFASYEKSGVVL